jgi:hypothetical protein
MSSVIAAALIAHVAFWILLSCGWWLRELRTRGTLLFLTCWLAGFALRGFVPHGGDLFAPYVAILAIVLVFIVFKGDVRLR